MSPSYVLMLIPVIVLMPNENYALKSLSLPELPDKTVLIMFFICSYLQPRG